MDQAKIDMFIASNANKFLPYRIGEIAERLKILPESSFLALNTINFKDPQTILIISILLGYLGIDRIMVGDTGLGILKLITFGGCGVWVIVDWFLIGDRAKECNYTLLNNALGYRQ